VDDLTFKSSLRQRHGSVTGAAICLGLAIAFGVVAGLTQGLAWTGSVAFGLGSLVFVGYLILTSRDFTSCDAGGIRCRVNGRYHEWSWSEIKDIEVRTYTRRGAPGSVVSVVSNNGDRFRLAVPTQGGANRDPEFADKVERIRAYQLSTRSS